MKAGKTMKQAAASWRSGSSSPKRTSRRRSKVPKKKTTRKKSGMRLPGGLGPKGILAGILGLTVAQRFVPMVAPGADKIAAGMGLRALGIGGGGPLAAVGIMELAAGFILPRIGIGATTTSTSNGGGTDF